MRRKQSPYRQQAQAGIENPVLQRSLDKIQRGFGRGVMDHWQTMPDGDLRRRAKSRRLHTLNNLDLVLARLASTIRERGGHVFFAKTAEDAVRYTLEVAKQHDVRSVVKGKSMTTAEIALDTPLQQAGIEVVETDLGEFIIQLAGDTPSHIIAPCIHMDRQQIGRLFADTLGIDYTEDPPALTQAARQALREKFFAADMGITGCNFACAETGQVTLVSNEGNIRMATTLPRIHLAIMGMERVAATLDEHQELLQLLTRGAAMQKLSTYVSYLGGPSLAGDCDGPAEFHLVVIDNGRSQILGDPEFREVLACIRCGACLNICPVYGKIGGHAYDSPYSGPIGAVITPLLSGINRHADLCQGETLCGACRDVCPVENDLPRMLSALRHKLAYGDKRWGVTSHNRRERLGFWLWAKCIANPRLYTLALRTLRRLLPLFTGPGKTIRHLPGGSGWTGSRNLPQIAAETFRERWLRQQREQQRK